MPEAHRTPAMTQAVALSQRPMEFAQNPTLPQQQPPQQQSFTQQLPDSQALPSNFQQFPQMMQQIPQAPRQQFVPQAPMMEQQVGQPYQP